MTKLKGLLGVLTELQVHIGNLKTSYQVSDVAPAGRPVILTASSKDVVFDANILDRNSPDYRMLFTAESTAHQALISLISLTVYMNANGSEEVLLDIPLLTIACKTSSLGYLFLSRDERADKNTNLISCNTVVTSPSANVYSVQIPILAALCRPRVKGSSELVDEAHEQPTVIPNLPRFDISFGVHDPSLRVVLEAAEQGALPPMIIGRLSSVYFEAHSSHRQQGYILNSTGRFNAGRLYYHSPSNEESDVLHMSQATLTLTSFLLPTSEARLECVLDGFQVELSRPEIVQCFATITATIDSQHYLPAKLPAARKHKPKKAPLSTLPTWLNVVKFYTNNSSILISGADPEVAPDLRGIKLLLEKFSLEYFSEGSVAQRDDGSISNDKSKHHKHRDLNIDAMPGSRKLIATFRQFQALTVDSGQSLNRLHPMVVLPKADFVLTQNSSDESDLLDLRFKVEDLVLGFSLYKVYAFLQALEVCRMAFVPRGHVEASELVDENVEGAQGTLTDTPELLDRPVQWSVDGKFNLLRIKSRLPLNENQMLDLDHVQVIKRRTGGPQLRTRYMRLYIQSPAYPDSWDRIASIRDLQLAQEIHTERVATVIETFKSLVVRTDGLRIRIPHQFVFYSMLEAITNSIKTSTQIIHRFVTRTNDYVIAQHPKTAKKLPRIRLRSRMLTIEVEDDPFEARLGLIFRVGLSEQRMREAREDAFDRKVVRLRDKMNGDKIHRTSTNGTHTQKSFVDSIRSGHPGMTISASYTDSLDSSIASGTSESFGDDFSEEREKLLHHNSKAWVLRMQFALSFRHKKMQEMRQQRWGKDDISDTARFDEDILELSNRPPLFSMNFAGVDFILDKPSFSLDHVPDYVHRVGRGMPKETQYGLLIPVSLDWKMDEARIQVRDYPLPLLHIPPLHSSQKIKERAWEFKTDLVIGEEFPEPEAIRHVEVCVIPSDTGREGSPSFSVEVQRTAGAVKTYAEMSIKINSSLPTRVHWGTSMQPAIADVMRIMDTLTKPQQDPSPKLGFWDKIGLVMHTSMKFDWKHDGDMHITLKGSRDPYVVLGSGAGLTKVFRGNVKWSIGVCHDSRKLMEVVCDEYMLAISDFSRRTSSLEAPRTKGSEKLFKHTLYRHHLSRKEIHFQKILMKLTGDVRWTAGLAFERHCEENECGKCDGKMKCRIWNFEPHWLVKMRIPEYSILPGGHIRDAFKGFRSHYIHGQISVTSRKREDTSESYNTIHLTPRTFAHFFDWIHSFSGNLSLPIRSGPLFPSTEGPKQKFGQHLMTLKYNLQIDPLYLSHVYRSRNAQDRSKIDMTGVKAKINSFTLDLHQRKEERVVTNKILDTERTSQHMAIYRGQVDLKKTDLRALTALFQAESSESAQYTSFTKDPLDPENNRGEQAAEIGEFDVCEEDVEWIDMDDFIELDTTQSGKSPVCRIIPLAYAPRFIYVRDTTQREGQVLSNKVNGVAIPEQRFGFEKTHYCSMVQEQDDHANQNLGETQRELWQQRQEAIERELKHNETRKEEVESQLREIPNSQALHEEAILRQKSHFVHHLTSNFGNIFAAELQVAQEFDASVSDAEFKTGDAFFKHIKEEALTFNNRFVVHDIQLKWNNTLRNIIIRYIQQVNQRRGFSYYMSQKAVRFLADLVDEQVRHIRKQADDNSDTAGPTGEGNIHAVQLDDDVEKLIRQLLDDRDAHFFVADETTSTENTSTKVPGIIHGNRGMKGQSDDLHDDYEAVNNYIVRLIAPQIQLQSEVNKDSVVVLAAQSMGMKILAVKDRAIAADDVSALVQRKFSVLMTGVQFFYAHQSEFHGAIANLLTQNSYGAEGDSYWPPWVPIESVYDFENKVQAFERVVNKTSALCTYTKNNQLRIKKNDHKVAKADFSSSEVEDRTDSVVVKFSKFNFAADSAQYYAMFTIAMDLLMYAEPLQKERNEQIEKILLAADFSDLSGAPEMVSSLQTRIRQMNDFKTQFKLHALRNDPQCEQDESRVENELEQCEDELFFLMKSVATAQQKREDRDSEVIPAMHWHLKADEILWHLKEGNKAFIDFGLSQASFQRTDNSDSSNYNTLEIEMMQGINLSPDPVFAELFAPYFGSDRTVVDVRRSKMVRIYWYMLEAIGGISVCDHFEVNLFPLRLQMEHDVGKKLFAYIFPDRQKHKPNTESESDSDNDDDGSSSSSDGEADDNSTSQSSRRIIDKFKIQRLRNSTSLPHLNHKASTLSSKPDSASIYSQDSQTKSSRRLSRSSSVTSLPRSVAAGHSKSLLGSKKKATNNSSDDLTAMMNRASKNMSLVYVKVPSVVLALSFKGAKAKNFVDVTDFVFKMPTIEYRNKTWSYLDLAEHLKREVIKAVLAHTGSLLKDKMTHYRKSKSRQSTLVRQLTSYRNYVPTDMAERHLSQGESANGNIPSAEHERLREDFKLQNRTSSAETSSLYEDQHGHGLFNNAIGRHIQHLSHIARHKDGLAEDNAESTLKKTRMLLGKFIDRAI
ncbi:Putative uncharacterized protein [Taphrina deformans PYCC 5710]|uniref:Uncharacterized protein n=1 Tax=Taphrina deformans (strain PYCC 5710 / ATCC 11124 / CBS 356.35 / IMI 108563 / JCM 9778 / NBRC 8474) TaxID=1097556 RepID=R4XCG1_TAPDE|nr:Putative uncharacterized protein [Taphrina deformans PYCC 5710]|eukprot:CCG82056.1 Putative uncharacterized protein [Taphrina deformans PYCC 5710]